MPRRLAQQQMTLSDLDLRFHISCAISEVADLLDTFTIMNMMTMIIITSFITVGDKCYKEQAAMHDSAVQQCVML